MARSRWLQRDIVEVAAKHALSVHEDSDSAPLTLYGIASCAASLAMVLSDEGHPNHAAAIERHLPPAGVENGKSFDAYCIECGQRVEHHNGAWICPTHFDRGHVRFEPRSTTAEDSGARVERDRLREAIEDALGHYPDEGDMAVSLRAAIDDGGQPHGA